MEIHLWQQIFTVAIVIAVFIVLVKEWITPDLAAMGAFVLLVLIGVLSPPEALNVFGSSAPITVASMFVMSAVLERTGLIELLAGRFETLAGNNPVRVMLVLLLLVAFLSAFVNNTPIVVVFLPIVLAHCRKFDLKASRFLIPLSYAAIVGGTCTIIGTSTNLIASGIAADSGMEPFGMFEVGKLGILFVIATIVYIILGGWRFIPDRITLSTLFDGEASHEFLTQVYVNKDSPLIGKLFPETPLAKRRNLRVIEVVREGRPLHAPLDELTLESGDQITMKTRASGVAELAETTGLDLLPDGDLGLDHVRTESAVLMEGIVGPDSRLAGHSLKELNFRQRFGVVILAIHRRGENLRDRFEEVKLAFGDTLLVQGPVDRMSELRVMSQDITKNTQDIATQSDNISNDLDKTIESTFKSNLINNEYEQIFTDYLNATYIQRTDVGFSSSPPADASGSPSSGFMHLKTLTVDTLIANTTSANSAAQTDSAWELNQDGTIHTEKGVLVSGKTVSCDALNLPSYGKDTIAYLGASDGTPEGNLVVHTCSYSTQSPQNPYSSFKIYPTTTEQAVSLSNMCEFNTCTIRN